MNPMQHNRRGYSIMEIVVTAAIIGILVLILAPVVSDRTRAAKVRAAEQDLENIANAQERAAVDTGYMYRFYVLDDVKGGDGQPNNVVLTDLVDGLQDEDQNTDIAPATNIFIVTGSPVPANEHDFSTNHPSLYNQLITNETAFGWQGPYCNWHRDVNRNDWPDDPWGNDYLLFTKHGVLRATDTDFIPDSPGIFIIPPGLGGLAAQTQVFDRPAVLTLGPDGLPGDGSANPNGDGRFGTGDDIYRKF